MKLTDALLGSHRAGAECRAEGWSIIHRSCSGFHLTPSIPDAKDHSRAQTWLFPNLYDLLIIARQMDFPEVDPEATDWRAVFGSWEDRLK